MGMCGLLQRHAFVKLGGPTTTAKKTVKTLVGGKYLKKTDHFSCIGIRDSFASDNTSWMTECPRGLEIH